MQQLQTANFIPVLLFPLDTATARVISLPLRRHLGCRVIELNEAARARAARKRIPSSPRFDPSDLTAA